MQHVCDFSLKLLLPADAGATDTDMNRVFVILAISLGVFDVSESFDADAGTVAASQLDNQKDLDTSGGAAVLSNASHGSTASDDVNCTNIDDVTAARKSLCPGQCRCWPVDGQQVWTKLKISCNGNT